MNILITGTSSGIGFGIALEFLKQGHKVYGISRRKNKGLEPYTNFEHLSIDLTNYPNVKKHVPRFISKVSTFDLVILNAGVLGEIRWATEQDVDAMKAVMEINVWANKVLLDVLFGAKKPISQVCGISSKASIRSTPGWGPYSMSKAGLNMLMDVYAKEFNETHFTAFAPGLVDSEIQEKIYRIKDTQHYPSAHRLQKARYTDDMPNAVKAAPMLIEGMQKALKYPSGSFVDVRDM
jgi:NAD(P)-dependent dehydrogenase (short-subunit alcohol dehydrogenase family)